jgi:hypothetical protein
MTELTIITNNVPRDVIYGHELSADERAEFGYIDWEAAERGEILPWFARYKGELYDLNDCEHSRVDGWDMQVTETFFSAVLFRWPRESQEPFAAIDSEHIVCGRCYS